MKDSALQVFQSLTTARPRRIPRFDIDLGMALLAKGDETRRAKNELNRGTVIPISLLPDQRRTIA